MRYISRPSVLCVGYEASERQCLHAALAEYECSFAVNGYEGLRALNARPFDTYILSYWLADWSGHLLCREIRKHDPHAAVLFCSDAVSDVHRDKALRAGARAYFTKPIDVQLLRQELAARLKVAVSDGVRAADRAEHALAEELRRRGVAAATLDGTAQALARLGNKGRTVERTARSRAYEAFLGSGGTRAQFDRWWAERCAVLFQSGVGVA